MMKTTETFAEFQTRFLHLAGQARIPTEDLMPDLFDKLTLNLQRVALPTYTSIQTLKELTDHCLTLDQGLRRIKARSNRMRARGQRAGVAPARDPPPPTTATVAPCAKPATAASWEGRFAPLTP